MGSILLAIFVFFYTFIVQPIQVAGSAMAPNYNNGESYTVSIFDKNYKRGDVVVFTSPIDKKIQYLKRIVAVPDDSVEVRSGKFYVNKEQASEPYLSENIITEQGAFLHESETYTLNENEFFLLGDNRVYSSDSRSWGPINKKDIVGKVWFKYGEGKSANN